MKRFVDVHRGEIMAGQGDVVLDSDTNGACLVIVAYDPSHKVGALAHALYLSGHLDRKWHSSALRDVSTAVDEMIEDMALVGADRNRIEISLVTGENVPHKKDDLEYQNNLAATIDTLKQKKLRFRADSLQDVGRYHVALDVGSGEIIYH